MGTAAAYVLSHPWQVFVIGWNWKTAVLGAIFRGALWPAAMAGREKILSTGSLRGMWIEFVFRVAAGGFLGSLMQAFSGARPAWLAGLFLAVAMPGCLHCLEYLALRAGGAAHPGAATVASVAFSVASLLVNWSLMRKGMLLTGWGAASLASDVRRAFREMARFPPPPQAAGENSGGPAA